MAYQELGLFIETKSVFAANEVWLRLQSLVNQLFPRSELNFIDKAAFKHEDILELMVDCRLEYRKLDAPLEEPDAAAMPGC